MAVHAQTDGDFTGTVVLISGAGGGFGIGAAVEFGKAGAKLVLTDYAQPALDSALEAAAATGAKAVGVTGDIALEETSAAAVELALSSFGRLDIAFNNAGMGHPPARLEKIENDMARKVIDVDLMGVFFAMKHQLPVMQKQFEEDGSGGAILNTASVAGVMGAQTLAIYAAAKHGVVGMTKAAALENARRNIRVNALCPAFTRTNMVREMLDTSPHGPEEAERRLAAGNPMRRLGEPEEVVQAVLWACNPRNSFYTGQAIILDGGLSIG